MENISTSEPTYELQTKYCRGWTELCIGNQTCDIEKENQKRHAGQFTREQQTGLFYVLDIKYERQCNCIKLYRVLW